MNTMIFIGLILFLGLAIWRLDWALLLIIAATPSYLIRFSILNIPMTLLEAMVLISFAVWFISRFLPQLRTIFRRPRNREKYPYAWEITALLAISLAAVVVGGLTNGALGIWKAYFLEPILVFILVLNVFSTHSGQKKILAALLVSSLAVSIFAIFQKITGLYIPNELWAAAETRRVVSFFGYPNAIGLFQAPLIMILSGWLFFISTDKKPKVSGLTVTIVVAIILAILSIWFARSEGAMIGLAAGIVVFGLLAEKSWRRITLAVIAVVLITVVSYSPLRQLVWEKATLSDLSGEIRRQQWTETINMLEGRRFVLGAGLDNYKEAIEPYHQDGIFFNRDRIANFDSVLYGSAELRAKYWQPTEIYLYPHNIFLNFWSELGLGGLLLFVWIIGRYLYSTLGLVVCYGREKKSEKYLALGLLTAMVALGVHGLVDVPYFKNDLSLIFWLMIALASGLSLSYRHERE